MMGCTGELPEEFCRVANTVSIPVSSSLLLLCVPPCRLLVLLVLGVCFRHLFEGALLLFSAAALAIGPLAPLLALWLSMLVLLLV